MFTLFDLLMLIGLGGGLLFGVLEGAKRFGPIGGIVGAIVGAYLGFIIGRLPWTLMLRSIARDLKSRTSTELREDLRGPRNQPPNLVLLELGRRGEDILGELPVVLDLLVAEDFGQRGRGWAALTSAFPKLAAQIRGYSISDSVEECRRKVQPLRVAA